MHALRLALLLSLWILPATGQQPSFEAIRVEASPAGAPAPRMRIFEDGRLRATAIPVFLLVRYAYDLPGNPTPRLTGLPDWAYRERWDVEAQPAGAFLPATTPAERHSRMRLMIRGLLADRFGLVMRLEQKNTPVYALSVAARGPKLQPAALAERDCIYDTGAPDGCHQFLGGVGHPLHGNAIDMDDLAGFIENWADLPVVNRTGLRGLFAVNAGGWEAMRLPPPPPPSPNGRPAPPANGRGTRDAPLPSIFEVLGTIGLELKPQIGAVTMCTVERIERPSTGGR